MRAPLLLLLLAGCNNTDVCADFAGKTCIALEVKSAPGSALTIDQLGISIDGVFSKQLTPSAPRSEAVALPVWVPVLPGDSLPDTLRLFVDALKGGALVGQAVGELHMRAGEHVSAGITLTDLTATPDLAGADFSGADLLAVPDLKTSGSPAFFAANDGLFGGQIISVLTDFAGGAAYVGTVGAGVFKTTNSGNSWVASNNGLDAVDIGYLASDDITGAIYASGSREGQVSGALYKTTNAGASWTHIIDTSAEGPIVATTDSLANPVLLLGLTDGGGILRSTDGVNFTTKNVGLTDMAVFSLVADPLNKGTLYAGTFSQKVFRTTNFGDSWSDISSAIPSTGGGVFSLAIDPHTQDLVAGTGAGIFVRPFGQSAFVAYTPSPPIPNVRALAFFQSASPDFYAGGPSGLFHLDGNKTSWTNASSGLTDHSILSVDIDRSSPALVYAGTQAGGVFVSSNSGTSFSAANSGITNLSVIRLAIDPQNPQTVWAGTSGNGLFKSNNGGMTWSPVSGGLPSGAGILAIALGPSAVFVATQDSRGTGATQAVFRSLDGGGSFNQVDANPAASLAVDPGNPMNVYAGGLTGTVRRSVNGGGNFTAAGATPTGVISLVVDPTNSLILYAATSNSGIFKSGDSASSWSQATTGITETAMSSLTIDPANPTHLWATGFNSIYRTTNAAGSWQQSASGASGAFNRVVYAGNNVLYASSSGGVFRSSDAAVSWTHLAGGHVSQDLAVDPTSSNTVYFAHSDLIGVTKTTSGGM